MKSNSGIQYCAFALLLLCAVSLQAQPTSADSSWKKAPKNVIRYNLSGALLFGFDRYIVFGYERAVGPHQSFSINIGGAGLPKLFSLSADSFYLKKDTKNSGYNISVDYRFYLGKENKYYAPHGVYIGPYISFNDFDRNNDWEFRKGSTDTRLVSTETTLKIFTAGFELGYQFVLWKRIALDMVLIGPGISTYKLNSRLVGDLTDQEKENLRDALMQLMSQKFPGMNYVFADKQMNANGVLNTTSIGFRYLIHIGFVF